MSLVQDLPASPVGAPALLRRDRPSVSWRSVTAGLAGAILICAVTPYNDYVLNNGTLVGNNLPIGAMLLTFLFTVAVNGPLSRFRPQWAMTTGELAVAFSMMLTACAVPSAGLMRYLPHVLVAPFSMAVGNFDYQNVIQSTDLPWWLFPRFSGTDRARWGSDPIATGFVGRWLGPGPIPLAAWTVPILAWAVFFFALYGALLCIVVLVRRQWFENERLPFPLAEIQLSILEAPPPRKMFNAVMSRRAFWIAFGIIFAVHLMNGAANYWPRNVPRIPLSFNLSGLTTGEPWRFMRWHARVGTIYFMVVGVSYFVPLHISFSWWIFFAAEQVYAMVYGSATGDNPFAGRADQHFGGIFAFAAALVWLGRRHWWLILRQSFRGRRSGEPTDTYLPYPVAFWGLVACMTIMTGWMIAAGCTVLAAIVAVLLLLLLFTVITRLVAEAGLIHGMLVAHLGRVWDLAAMAGLGKLVPMNSYFVTSMVDASLYDFREVASVYASHGMKLADTTDAFASRRQGAWKFIALLGLALIVGYFVSFYSTLHVEYTHGTSLDSPGVSPINPWGSSGSPRTWLMDPATKYHFNRFYSPSNSFAHIAAGFGIVAFLSYMRMTFAWWPLHPVGYLMLGTFPGNVLWFSVFLGWLAKKTVVSLGGSKMYVSAKPFFLGIVMGESLAAGFWMLIGIVLSSFGATYRPVVILPG